MPSDLTPEETAALQEELAAFHRAAKAKAALAKGAVGFGTRTFIGRRLVGARPARTFGAPTSLV